VNSLYHRTTGLSRTTSRIPHRPCKISYTSSDAPASSPTRRTRYSTQTKNPPLTHSTVKDKAQHAVVLDKSVNEKLQKDVQSYRLITVATLVDRLKINGSLARQALNDLEEKGQIKKIVGHHSGNIYSTSSPPFSSMEKNNPQDRLGSSVT
jgi:small subunit ribosomal protein S25e